MQVRLTFVVEWLKHETSMAELCRYGIMAPGIDVLAGQACVAVAGLIILWRRWREAVKQEVASRSPLTIATVPACAKDSDDPHHSA